MLGLAGIEHADHVRVIDLAHRRELAFEADEIGPAHAVDVDDLQGEDPALGVFDLPDARGGPLTELL